MTYIPTQISSWLFCLYIMNSANSNFILSVYLSNPVVQSSHWQLLCPDHIYQSFIIQAAYTEITSVWSCQQLHWTQTQISLSSKVTLVSCQKKKSNIPQESACVQYPFCQKLNTSSKITLPRLFSFKKEIYGLGKWLSKVIITLKAWRLKSGYPEPTSLSRDRESSEQTGLLH